jgi:erythromycin esterase-like protein
VSRLAFVQEPRVADVLDRVRPLLQPCASEADLDPLLERIGDARFVLLGEASHGTADYYAWRARLSQRLIREHGFSFIAVEGDWPDCSRVNRWVKGAGGGPGGAREVLDEFRRWPTWMWANTDIVRLMEWLRGHNASVPAAQRVGFHGLDVYSLWESLEAIIGWLQVRDPDALPAALRAFRCFEPYGEDVQEYALATRMAPETCEDEVVALLAELRRWAPEHRSEDPEGAFEAEQNAWVLRNAEAYYRAMVRGGPGSWNIRDRHMAATLERLVRHYGPGCKAIVWEHNTHVGDARATDMAAEGLLNVGQLVRQAHGARDVVLVGFGSHHGRVIAGREWGAPMESLPVPPAREGSWEHVLHEASDAGRALLLSPANSSSELLLPRGHRAIGVVYHPERERFGNYVPTVLTQRYDAFIFLDETRALQPLGVPGSDEGEVPETWPWGE